MNGKLLIFDEMRGVVFSGCQLGERCQRGSLRPTGEEADHVGHNPGSCAPGVVLGRENGGRGTSVKLGTLPVTLGERPGR